MHAFVTQEHERVLHNVVDKLDLQRKSERRGSDAQEIVLSQSHGGGRIKGQALVDGKSVAKSKKRRGGGCCASAPPSDERRAPARRTSKNSLREDSESQVVFKDCKTMNEIDEFGVRQLTRQYVEHIKNLPPNATHILIAVVRSVGRLERRLQGVRREQVNIDDRIKTAETNLHEARYRLGPSARCSRGRRTPLIQFPDRYFAGFPRVCALSIRTSASDISVATPGSCQPPVPNMKHAHWSEHAARKGCIASARGSLA